MESLTVARRIGELRDRLDGAVAATDPIEQMRARLVGDVLLGKLIAADFNTTADQAIPITFTTRYRVRRIFVLGATISLTNAAGGFYSDVAKGGNAIVAASQVYSALTTSIRVLDLTLTNEAENVQTLATLYFSLTTAQGAPATADIYILGDVLP